MWRHVCVSSYNWEHRKAHHYGNHLPNDHSQDAQVLLIHTDTRKNTSSAILFTPSYTHIMKTPQWGYNILEKTEWAPENRSVPVQPHTVVAASAREIQRLSQHYISFTHTISLAQVQPHGGANKQILIPHPGNAMNRGILHFWWQTRG